MITQKRLRKLFHYNKKTGIFRWRWPEGGGVKRGDIAGCKNQGGYIQIQIDRKLYKAHRLAWLYTHGYFPEHEIDHINRIKYDNRLFNLREASRQCNLRNSKIQRNNISKITGVYYCKPSKKWIAQIGVNWKVHYLGYHEDFDEAVAHRLAAEQCLNWNGCNSTSSAYKYSLQWI